MKSFLFLTLTLSILTDFFASAQVTSPTKDSVWYPGDKMKIIWNTSNELGPMVAIYLTAIENPPVGTGIHRGKIFYVAYYTVANSQGQFEWTVPEDVTTDRVYRIDMVGNAPYEKLHSQHFHVRFGKKRTETPTLKIEQAMYLSWSATYGRTYELQTSADLQTWTSAGTLFADDEELGATVITTEKPEYYRLQEIP